MHDPERIGRGFDRLALIYDRCVNLFFGARLNAIQQEILQGLPARDTCLIIGGGTGAILKTALGQGLAKTYVYAELSREMIASANNRLTGEERGRVRFTGDWKTVVETGPVDYLILPFVLDCYNETTISAWLDEFESELSPDALVIVADFNREQDFGYRPNPLYDIFLSALYLFFRITVSIEALRLPRIARLMRERGYVFKKAVYRNNGWLQASQWSRNIAAVTPE